MKLFFHLTDTHQPLFFSSDFETSGNTAENAFIQTDRINTAQLPWGFINIWRNE